MSTMIKTVVPASMKPVYENFEFAPGTQVGNLLILSGQIGIGPDGKAPSDLEEQFKLAFDAVGKILQEAGCSCDDIVDLHTFHVGLQEHLETFMDVKANYIKKPFPSWTAIGCTELAVPGGVLEIKATAFVPD